MSQAQLMEIKLSRFDAQPWGFRLQGGVDFAMPLIVQKVNGGSLAEQAGLMPGDAVIKINDVDVYSMRHKEAQDVVVRSGNNFVMTVQRGGSTWRPHVVPTGQLPKPNSPYLQTVTKTSLAHKQPPVQHIGCGYNSSARPFANCTGGDGSVKSIVNKQYNSPVGIYSDEAIAETLSAQAEILAGGVLGVNFKKNEKEYQPDKSEVLKLLREEESGGQSSPEPRVQSTTHYNRTVMPQKKIDERVGALIEATLFPNMLMQQQQQQQQQHQYHHEQQQEYEHEHQYQQKTLTTISKGNNDHGSHCHSRHSSKDGIAVAVAAAAAAANVDSVTSKLASKINIDGSSATVTATVTATTTATTAAMATPTPTPTPTADPRLIMMPICPALQTPEFKAELEASTTDNVDNAAEHATAASGHPPCQLCGVGIVGVFVRIKDKNLHVECFKCATCGTSLKNQGYYNFNNKLYCDIHAKLAALQSPPSGTEGYVPVPIKPNTKLSASSISSALNAHGYNGLSNGSSAGGNSMPMTTPINQGYVRPFGAATSGRSQVPAAAAATVPSSSSPFSTMAPKSPVIFPPQTSSNTPTSYATLPRSNFSQQYQQQQQGGGILPPKGGVFGATTAPKRGRGIMNKAVSPGARIPLCNSCNTQIRGPFITALGRIWCPEHFICVNANCRRPLQDIGFVEEKGDLYCEYCFEKYLAPTCNKCANKIKGDCLNAIGKHFHPECFSCAHCGKLFGNTPFFLEDGEPYCEADWNELFTTKCYACGFPVEAGDRWVEALNHNYHSQCFNCTFCKQNLEGQSFYNKGGRPFCKNHAR